MPYPFDENISKYLRMNSMFGGPMGDNDMLPPQMQFQQQLPLEDTNDDQLDLDYFKSRMNQLYQPDTTMTDKFHQMINQMPQREDPSTWRKIAAIGASFGGQDDVEKTLYSPYHRKMQDFQTNLKPVEEAAKLEMGNNVNLRSVANQILSQESGQRRLERQIQRDRVLQDQGNRRITGTETNRNRVGDQRDRALDQADRRIDQNDILKFEVDDNGKDVIIMKDGRTVPVDGLDYLSAEEKASLKKRYSTSGSRDRVETGIIDDPDNPGKRIAVIINKDTGEIKRAKITSEVTGKDVTVDLKPKESTSTEETGESREITNNARRFAANNTKLGKYVKIDKQGGVTIQRPGWGGYTGPTEQERQEIYKAIYGSNGPGAPGTELAGKKAAAPGMPPPGFVRVTGPKGEKGRMSLQEWKSKDWTKEGWRMVQ